MRTIRLTNGEVSRLCRAYNTGVFIHKISYLPAAVPQRKILKLAQNVKIRLNLTNEHINNLSMTAVFKKREKKITLIGTSLIIGAILVIMLWIGLFNGVASLGDKQGL